MRYILNGVVLLLVSGLTWQPALGGEPDAGSAVSAQGDVTTSRPDCDRRTPEAFVESKVSVQGLLGIRVVNPLGHDIGRVADLILDRCGRLTHMVVHVGGFMGIGGRYVRLTVGRIRLQPRDRPAAWVALVRETRRHLLTNHEKYPLGQASN